MSAPQQSIEPHGGFGPPLASGTRSRTIYRHRAGLPLWHRFSLALVDCLALAAGVAALVLAAAASHSAAHLSSGPIYGLERDVVVVEGVAPSSSGLPTGVSHSSLTSDDVAALGNNGFVPDALAIAPTAGAHVPVATVSRTAGTDVLGTTDAFARALGYQIAQGRMLTSEDVTNGSRVIVLGQTLVNALFGGGQAVGQQVLIADEPYEVVGTFAPKGYSGAFDQDDLAAIPITAAWNDLFPHDDMPIDQVLLRAGSAGGASAVTREATSTLLARHQILDPAQADFTIVRQSQLVGGPVGQALAVRRLLEGVGVVFLLVGAIHIAAISRIRFSAVLALAEVSADRVAVLSLAFSVGFIGAGLGVVVAAVLAPALRHLEPGLAYARVTVFGAVVGAAVGLVAAVAALLPTILQRREVLHRPLR